MKKMTKGLTVLTAAVLLFAFAGQARAFCVHNGSDAKIAVTENISSFGAFSAKLESTESACCNWQNEDCNPSGKQDTLLPFTVEIKVPGGWLFNDYHCYGFKIRADGDLYVYKKNDGYVCGDTLPPMPVPPPPPVIK